MRAELGGLLDALEPPGVSDQLGLDGKPAPQPALPLTERARIWDLAIRLGRELGTAIDAHPEPTGPAVPSRPARRGRVDYG